MNSKLRAGDELPHNPKCMWIGSVHSKILNYNAKPISNEKVMEYYCQLCDKEKIEKCKQLLK